MASRTDRSEKASPDPTSGSVLSSSSADGCRLVSQILDERRQVWIYLCRLTFEVDVLSVHDVQQNLESDDKVRVDDRPRLVTFFLGEAPAVNDSHLLDDR